MTDTIPPAIRVALLVILNHVEPGWEDCVGLVNQWLDASNPTRQDSDTAETSTQQVETFNEKEEHENDLRQESIRDFETWETDQQGEKESPVDADAAEAEDQLREANDRQGE